MRTRDYDRTAGPERVHKGIGVSPGVAIGPAHVVDTGFQQVPEYRITKDRVESEIARFQGAVAKSVRQVRKVRSKSATLPDTAAEDVSFLMDAHLAILRGSRLIRGVEQRIVNSLCNAEAAVQTELAQVAKQFERVEDPYLSSRVQDIRDVATRLIRNLTDRKYRAFSTLPTASVVLAEELTPADTALMDPRQISGFATLVGGPESHTAIMARSLDLPAVVGVSSDVLECRAGALVIVDGDHGLVVVDPSPETLTAFEQRRAEQAADREQLKRLAKVPAQTRDLVAMSLMANIELPREVDLANAVGADGVGLLRTEFLFMNRSDLPSEEEQYAVLRDIVVGMKGRPVTLRTIDVGGDKLAETLHHRTGTTTNPALGLRAIRLSLSEPRLLETQLAAMLRAGAHGPTRILLPMVSTVAEVRAVRATLERVARRLRRRRVAAAESLPPLGVMIEVPGAALAADALAMNCDFFAIGTNDLIMYTLAIDRGDEQVAHLYSPLHPAVLRLIQFTTGAALRARIPVNVCGEMAGDERMTALLLGLGIRDLSMASAAVPRVKQRVRALDLSEATRRAQTIMDQADAGMVAVLLDDFNALA
ncbi:MAG: phosphoenolpyruvate--protein phosphotransferase [Rhodospirillaceae bacterium]|nr:phosphoenolpyruvate--protein phosphotransferase [Rhodospirillaceae bacterium]